jgi:DNA-binding MurR/RpiR family transcriptional regulator
MTPTQARIVTAFDELSPAHQRIARVVLDDAVAAALSSAEALGRRADANPATIVRFAQAVGFSGWAQLREALRADVPHLATAVERLEGPAARGAELDGAVIAAAVRNVEETARLNDPAAIDAAIAALTGARRVLVVGLGMEAPIADVLAAELGRSGLDARRLGAGSLPTAAIELASAGADDVVLGMAIWRYFADTTRVFETAVEAGATGIAITDTRVAPLTRRAATVLLAADDAPLMSHSLTGVLALVDVLTSRVLAAAPDVVRERMRRLDEVYGALEVIDD